MNMKLKLSFFRMIHGARIPMDSLPHKVWSLDFLGSLYIYIYENMTFFLDTWAISLEMTQMMDPLFSIWNLMIHPI